MFFEEEKNWFYNFIVKSGGFFSIKKYFLALFKFASIGFLMFFFYILKRIKKFFFILINFIF